MDAPETVTAGQAEPGTQATETTHAAPDMTNGQANVSTQAGTTGQPDSGATQADSFFDPNDVPEELQGAYKNMQASYTKKMQALSQHRQKVDAYDSFMRDPVGQMQQMASRYGYQLSRAEAQNALQQAHQGNNGMNVGVNGDHEPQTWQEVYNNAAEMAYKRFMSEMQPVIQNVNRIQASSFESEFDRLDPQWRDYEDNMRDLLQSHPTLSSSPALLYKLAVPDEVSNSRAMQKALKQLESKTKAAQVGSKSTTQHASQPAGNVKSFDDAVKEARMKMAEGRR